MRYLFLLLTLALLCCSNTQNRFDVPSGFYFKISDGANNSYNSKTALFKRCYSNGAKSYEISLNDAEIRMIYNLYKEIHFYNFPKEFEIEWNDTDTVTIVTPRFDTSMEICEDDSCNKVILNLIDLENPISNKEKAQQYKRLYDKIWQIIMNKEEYTDIPDSDCIYL